MKNKSFPRFMPLALLFLCLSALGCGPGSDKRNIFYTSGNWAIPPSFHGNFWAPGGDGSHKSFVFEPLFLYVPLNGRFEPRLGLNYELAPDRRSLKVELRRNVLWHDGEVFTSLDVVSTYLLGYVLGWPVWQGLKLVDISADSDFELSFHWNRAATDREIIQVLSFGEICYPAHLFGAWNKRIRELIAKEHRCSAGMASGVSSNIVFEKKRIRDELFRLRPPLPVGTGPFVLKRVTADMQRLVRFDRSWSVQSVGIDEVRIIRVPDNRMAWAVLISGELDASNAATPFDVAQRILELNPKMKLSCPSDMQEFGFIFNTTRSPTSDLAFRRAVAHVLDRRMITRVSYYYSSPVVDYSTGILLSYRDRWLDPAFLSGLTRYEHSLVKAGNLLERAGYSRNREGLWIEPNGAPINLEIVTVPNSDWVMGAEVAASQLCEFGIPARVRIMPAELVGMRLRDRNFDMAAQMGTDFKRMALPEMTYRRYFGKGGYIAGASGIADEIRQMEKVDVARMVMAFDAYMPAARKRRLIKRLAFLANEYLPFLSVYEKKLMLFKMEGVRVKGWPPDTDPLWTVSSSGIEAVYASFIRQGRLTGVER